MMLMYQIIHLYVVIDNIEKRQGRLIYTCLRVGLIADKLS